MKLYVIEYQFYLQDWAQVRMHKIIGAVRAVEQHTEAPEECITKAHQRGVSRMAHTCIQPLAAAKAESENSVRTQDKIIEYVLI